MRLNEKDVGALSFLSPTLRLALQYEVCLSLSGTQSAILNPEPGDSESCDSNRRGELGDSESTSPILLYCDSLNFVILAAEILVIPGLRLLESCDSRFPILCR